jgi:Ca2+-binding RTX toxin-like protein
MFAQNHLLNQSAKLYDTARVAAPARMEMGRQTSIEILEDRRLFAIGWLNHIINVGGAPKAPNTITVGLNPGGASVFAELSYPTKKGTFSQTKSFALTSKIRWINIVGGNASDLITVDQTNGTVPLVVRVTTHNGNDTVIGGAESDRVVCGNGIDEVMSGDGNDILLAGGGPDTLVAGNGNDQLHSGPGHDLLVAGNGNNTFVDPYGHVTLQGGTGHDTYILKSIQLDPVNNYTPGKDTLQHYVPPKGPNMLLNDILNGLLDYGGFL